MKLAPYHRFVIAGQYRHIVDTHAEHTYCGRHFMEVQFYIEKSQAKFPICSECSAIYKEYIS